VVLLKKSGGYPLIGFEIRPLSGGSRSFSESVWPKRAGDHRTQLHFLGAAAAIQAFPPDTFKRGIEVGFAFFGSAAHGHRLSVFPKIIPIKLPLNHPGQRIWYPHVGLIPLPLLTFPALVNSLSTISWFGTWSDLFQGLAWSASKAIFNK